MKNLLFILLLSLPCFASPISLVSPGDPVSSELFNDVASKAESILPVPGPEGLRGPTGPAGAPGMDGVQGIQGPQGLPGIEGLKGLTGDAGIQGIQGVQGNAGVIPDEANLTSSINSKVQGAGVKKVTYINYCFSPGQFASGQVKNLGWFNLDKVYPTAPTVILGNATNCHWCAEIKPVVSGVSTGQVLIFFANGSNTNPTPVNSCWDFVIFER